MVKVVTSTSEQHLLFFSMPLTSDGFDLWPCSSQDLKANGAQRCGREIARLGQAINLGLGQLQLKGLPQRTLTLTPAVFEDLEANPQFVDASYEPGPEPSWPF